MLIILIPQKPRRLVQLISSYKWPLRPHAVAADLYLAAPGGSKGTAIWSTHKASGFLFSADKGPQPFEYQAGVGGVVAGWEDGVASMQTGELAQLSIPWKYACESCQA